MNKTLVLDTSSNEMNIAYIFNELSAVCLSTNSNLTLSSNSDLSSVELKLDDNYKGFMLSELEDKIADAIAIGYKYQYFKNNLKIAGVSSDEREILLASLIACDLIDDKKYVLAKIKSTTVYSISGLFNFRLKNLKAKWAEILSFMPTYFMPGQLKEFLTFLYEDFSQARVFIYGNNLYDKKFNKLNKSFLMQSNTKYDLIKDVILSRSKNIEVLSPISKIEEDFLNEYFPSTTKYNITLHGLKK